MKSSSIPYAKIGLTIVVSGLLLILFAAGAFADLQRILYGLSHGGATPSKDYRVLQCTVKVENALITNDGKIDSASCSKGTIDVDQFECSSVPQKTFFFGNDLDLRLQVGGQTLDSQQFNIDEPAPLAPPNTKDLFFKGCVPKITTQATFALFNPNGGNIDNRQVTI